LTNLWIEFNFFTASGKYLDIFDLRRSNLAVSDCSSSSGHLITLSKSHRIPSMKGRSRKSCLRPFHDAFVKSFAAPASSQEENQEIPPDAGSGRIDAPTIGGRNVTAEQIGHKKKLLRPKCLPFLISSRMPSTCLICFPLYIPAHSSDQT
jgi:hypothetical protein